MTADLSKEALVAATLERAATVVEDGSPQQLVGEIGNQIHNIACEIHDNEDLQERLGELRPEAWRVSALLATPAQTDALAAVRREARAEGMRMAADMLLPGPTSKEGLWAQRLAARRAAILAAADEEAINA